MIDKYPADIRTWIETRGGAKKMPLVGYWVLYASDLWEMGYRKCD